MKKCSASSSTKPPPPAGTNVPRKAAHPRSLEALARPDGLGSLAHYANPAFYTRAYRRRLKDVGYYVELARQSGGPVLEYGIGNGRVALPVARQGVAITGIDLSRPMLADLKEQLKKEPQEVARRVSLKYGDMRKVKLGRRFPLVIAPFNVVLHLYERTDVEAFLGRVKEHLTPQGEFVFDYSLPQPGDLGRDPNRRYRVPPFVDPTTKKRVHSSERFFYERFKQTLLVWSEYEPAEGRPWDVPLTHRQFFPQEMEALLHYNGFEVMAYCPDFAQQGWLNWVDSMVVHCRLRRPLRRKRSPST